MMRRVPLSFVKYQGLGNDFVVVDATRDVLQQHGGLWFYDESFVISRRRE